MQIIELFRKSNCGQGVLEQISRRLTLENNPALITEDALSQLTNAVSNTSNDVELLAILDQVEPDTDYYIYYKYHHCSGHRTEITVVDDKFHISVEEPEGICLQAFFSEIIIFKKGSI